jgi:hypothetical protein
VSGGGWITAGNSRGNFGLNAGFQDGSTTPDVHATYIDHGAGLKVKATGIDLYEQGAAPTSRRFAGPAEANGLSDRYEIEVADNGEPGRGDSFRLKLDSGYSAMGTLAGGNIQLHKPCP